MKTITVPLGEVMTIDRTTASAAECRTSPYVGLEHIEKDAGHFVAEFRRQSETLLATKFRFTARHVLYGKLRPNLNKVALPDFDGVCSTEIFPLLPRPHALDRRYLYALLLSQPFVKWASNSVAGANLPRLDPERLREYEVELPDLPEQRRIAGRLEQADRLARTRRYALDLTGTFLPAAFLGFFGDGRANTKQWDSATLGELVVRGPQNGIYKPASAYGAGTPILRIDAFYDGAVTEIGSLKRVRLAADEIKCFGLNENDIVVNRVNSRPYLGKSALIPRLKEPTVFESNMMRVTLNTRDAVPVYITHYLQTSFIKAQIQVLAKDAVNQSSINQEDVKGLIVRLPPIALQRHFAALAERVERLRAVQREALRQAEHLFASILHRAFNG